MAANLSEYSGVTYRVVGVMVALSLFFLNIASTSAFVKYRAGSSDWSVGCLPADRVSVFVGVALNWLERSDSTTSGADMMTGFCVV